MKRKENYGLIIRLLRNKKGLTIRALAELSGRSIGWHSEIENSRGTCRIRTSVFEKMLALMSCSGFKPQFKTMVASYSRMKTVDRRHDGRLLRKLRHNKQFTQVAIARKCLCSNAHISRIERGIRQTTAELQAAYMKACGMHPDSFRKFRESLLSH